MFRVTTLVENCLSNVVQEEEDIPAEEPQVSNEHDKRLADAATIGAALMLVNSRRALILL